MTELVKVGTPGSADDLACREGRTRAHADDRVVERDRSSMRCPRCSSLLSEFTRRIVGIRGRNHYGPRLGSGRPGLAQPILSAASACSAFVMWLQRPNRATWPLPRTSGGRVRCMAKTKVVARFLGNRLECIVEASPDLGLLLSGKPRQLFPIVEGSSALAENRALVDNAWSCALFTHQGVTLPTLEEQDAAHKRVRAHRSVVLALAELAAHASQVTKDGWCSGCFTMSTHRKAKTPKGQLPAYLCSNCGSPTLGCAARGCPYMATRSGAHPVVPRYCAEHRHEIPGFEKSAAAMHSIGDYESFLSFDSPNLSRATKIAGVQWWALEWARLRRSWPHRQSAERSEH